MSIHFSLSPMTFLVKRITHSRYGGSSRLTWQGWHKWLSQVGDNQVTWSRWQVPRVTLTDLPEWAVAPFWAEAQASFLILVGVTCCLAAAFLFCCWAWRWPFSLILHRLILESFGDCSSMAEPLTPWASPVVIPAGSPAVAKGSAACSWHFGEAVVKSWEAPVSVPSTSSSSSTPAVHAKSSNYLLYFHQLTYNSMTPSASAVPPAAQLLLLSPHWLPHF